MMGAMPSRCWISFISVTSIGCERRHEFHSDRSKGFDRNWSKETSASDMFVIFRQKKYMEQIELLTLLCSSPCDN